MSDEIIKLNINYRSDIEAVVVALANAGYPVYVEEEKYFHGSSFFVCFRLSKEKAR